MCDKLHYDNKTNKVKSVKLISTITMWITIIVITIFNSGKNQSQTKIADLVGAFT